MCEIFGMSSIRPRKLNDELKEFFSHSEAHPDGWGLAVFDDDDVNIEKEPVKASKSKYLRERLREPIVGQTSLAHIRYATVGNVEYRNCHPYTKHDISGRQWTFIHNGTIFDFPELMKYSTEQKGDTDSERILLYLIDEINRETREKGEPLTAAERFDVLDKMVYEMSEGNKLNLLIYDGELLYAHYNSEDSLHYKTDEGTVYISTQALKKGLWRPFPFTRLMAFADGTLRYEGTEHGHRYIEDKELVSQMYLTYSGL